LWGSICTVTLAESSVYSETVLVSLATLQSIVLSLLHANSRSGVETAGNGLKFEMSVKLMMGLAMVVVPA